MLYKKSVGSLRILESLNMDKMSSILNEKSFEGSSFKSTFDSDVFYPKKTIRHDSTLLEHILFSLKHEKINLFVLSLGLRNISEEEIYSAIESSPNSAFVRKASLLWESANNTELALSPGTISSKYIDFFDNEQYITGTDKRYAKWRVNFNGISDLNWCPVILKTKELNRCIENDVFKKISSFAIKTDKRILDRAIEWAYLSETSSSFAIEREKVSQGKKEAFAQILKEAQHGEHIDEEYLSHVQSEVLSNPFDKAVSYRTTQNWLQNGNGSSSVTYVPPEPALASSLMQSIEFLANEKNDINPICLATVISFGFVYAHPFMDGNGRVSRFLIHHAINKSGKMPDNLMLPISMAMKRNEKEYLSALEGFSLPARKLCDVQWLHQDEFDFQWDKSSDLLFKYPDLTNQAVFLFEMADKSLSEDIQNEIDYLIMYDKIYSKVDSELDIQNNYLSTLISIALNKKSKGLISNKKRKKFAYKVSTESMDYIQEVAVSEIAKALIEKVVSHYNEHDEFPQDAKDELSEHIEILESLHIDNDAYKESCELLSSINSLSEGLAH